MTKITLSILEQALKKAWGKDTSYCPNENGSASRGQCAVSAMIIQDHIGGEICKVKVGSESHYFNLINKEIFDLTRDQFLMPIDYSSHIYADRNKFHIETIQRYNTLKSRVDKLIELAS
jgi:hypothetical protein